MFGVDFSELALIFLVALVVLGPKRMSGLVTKIGRWVGKARVMATDFRRQLENEINLDELNKMTDLQSQQTRDLLPTPPPGLNGEPAPETPTFPYSVGSTAADAPTAQSAPTDDTYSHAHAAGEPPMSDAEAEVAPPAAAATEATIPTQAALDLGPAPDNTTATTHNT